MAEWIDKRIDLNSPNFKFIERAFQTDQAKVRNTAQKGISGSHC